MTNVIKKAIGGGQKSSTIGIAEMAAGKTVKQLVDEASGADERAAAQLGAQKARQRNARSRVDQRGLMYASRLGGDDTLGPA